MILKRSGGNLSLRSSIRHGDVCVCNSLLDRIWLPLALISGSDLRMSMGFIMSAK